jgi:hypothetical protein
MYHALSHLPDDQELAMRQTELRLSDADRALIESYRAKGLRHAREVNRAHVLSALDRGIPESQIMAVLGVGRTAIWRTRAAYREGGAEYALRDLPRPGKPRRYGADVEVGILALAAGEAAPVRALMMLLHDDVHIRRHLFKRANHIGRFGWV